MAILRVFRNRANSPSGSIDAYETDGAGTVLLLVDDCAGFGSLVVTAASAVDVTFEESPLKVGLVEGDTFTAGDFPFELAAETSQTALASKFDNLAGRSYAVTVTGTATISLLVAK